MAHTTSTVEDRGVARHDPPLATLPKPKPSTDVPIVIYVDGREMGGLATYAVRLADGFRRQGYRVAAICNRAETMAPMRDMLRDVGADVRAIEDADFSIRARTRLIRRFASVVREYKGCVLVLMMGYFWQGAPISVAGRLAGARAIVRAELMSPHPPISWRNKVLTKLKDLLLDRIVVGAIENRDAYVKLLARSESQIDVVHTGIDLEAWTPGVGREEVRAGFGYSPDTLVIGTHARLGYDVWRKGIPVFLEMAAQVAPAFPQARFLVVGDGMNRQLLERQAEELGIRDRVLFAGWRSDIPQILAAMDVFVMPSLFEGGPTTVLEAMAMGKPVVASCVGMVPEVIGEGQTGLIVEPGNAAATAAAVSRLASDADLRLRLGTNARQEALRNFSTDRMVDGYLQVFADALT